MQIISCKDTKLKARYYKLQKRKGIEEGKKKEEVQKKKETTEKISYINADHDFEHVDLNEEIDKILLFLERKLGILISYLFLFQKQLGRI